MRKIHVRQSERILSIIFENKIIIKENKTYLVNQSNVCLVVRKKRKVKEILYFSIRRVIYSVDWIVAYKMDCCRGRKRWPRIWASTTAVRRCPSSTILCRCTTTGRTCPVPIRTIGRITRYRHTSLWVQKLISIYPRSIELSEPSQLDLE